ncbi:MAG: tetratricopeptide repeat protein [Anaeromyxobacter sp.]
MSRARLRSPPAHPSPAAAWLRALDWLAARPRRAVALAAAVPFLVTLVNPPILDDGWAALDNPLTWSLSNVGRIFGELYGYAGNPTVRGPYRPITTLSYALNHALHGPLTPGFHAVNVALHVAASLLVLALARRLALAAAPAQAPRLALLAGLLFALHPAHVEAVATIFGRTEPLAACFSVGALLLALDWRRAWWRLPAALAVLTLGVLSKETAIVTPVLFAILAWAAPAAAGLEAAPGLRGRAALRSLAVVAGLSLALLLAALPYFLLRGGFDVAVAPEARWFPVGTPGRHVAMTMSRVLGEYLRILAWPGFLGGDFAYAARIRTLEAPTAGFAVATAGWALTLAAGLWLWWTRRAPLLGAGLLCIFVPLLPVLQLVPVGVLLAERLLYLPSLGVCLAGAALLTAGLAGAPPFAPSTPPPPRAAATLRANGSWLTVAAVLALAVPGALAVRTVVRTLDWVTAIRFWESELEKAPREVVVNNNLAVAYTSLAGRDPAQAPEALRKAAERLEVALQVAPWYWRAHVNLGIARDRQGDLQGALRAFAAARRIAPREPSPWMFTGQALEHAGRNEEALAAYLESERRSPEDVQAPLQRGRLLERLGRRDEARAELERALERAPRNLELRRALDELGRP